jgi:hypothetical protein
MAVHVVAPWLNLPSVKTFRSFAGRPDSPTLSDGGNENHMAKGIRGIAPQLAIEVANQVPWVTFGGKAKAESRPAALILLSSALPSALQYGFGGVHAVTVEHLDDKSWAIANPLAAPHSAADVIDQRDLRTAVEAYDPKGVHAVLMPSAAVALRTHPLYVPPPVSPAGFTQAQLDAAATAARDDGFGAGYDEAKAKAEAAAVAGIRAV